MNALSESKQEMSIVPLPPPGCAKVLSIQTCYVRLSFRMTRQVLSHLILRTSCQSVSMSVLLRSDCRTCCQQHYSWASGPGIGECEVAGRVVESISCKYGADGELYLAGPLPITNAFRSYCACLKM